MSNRVPNRYELTRNGIIFKKFYGHTAKEMGHYAKYLIEEYNPVTVLVIAGTNDISITHKRGIFTAELIAENIIKVGRIGAAHGATVLISGLFVRRNKLVNKLTSKVDAVLKTMCDAEGL